MTTIAYRDGVLAADSLVTLGETALPGATKKITRLPSGDLFGFCGALADGMMLLKALLDEEEDLPTWRGGTTGVLIEKKTGRISVYEGHGPFIYEPARFGAWGSGMEFALGALAAGASAEQAVKIATKFDINSRGPVRALKLKD